MATRLRVLLVEDEPALQRFVALALEDEAVRLQGCMSVDEALLALATQRFELIITDLMLPGRNGRELLATLRQRPALRGQARLAVFSAGLTPVLREELQALGVTHFLTKPCALSELQACLAGLAPAAAAAPQGAAEGASAAAGEAMSSQHRAASEKYFGGNHALYQAFLARCRLQFPKDIEVGRRASENGEFDQLRHLAHSLKSVLLTLGQEDGADVARGLEQLADQALKGDAAAAQVIAERWPALEAAIQQLL